MFAFDCVSTFLCCAYVVCKWLGMMHCFAAIINMDCTYHCSESSTVACCYFLNNINKTVSVLVHLACCVFAFDISFYIFTFHWYGPVYCSSPHCVPIWHAMFIWTYGLLLHLMLVLHNDHYLQANVSTVTQMFHKLHHFYFYTMFT